MKPANALAAAIKYMGSRRQLADRLHVDEGTIRYWQIKGRAAPQHVLAIEYVTGISRHDLRPDIYPRGGK